MCSLRTNTLSHTGPQTHPIPFCKTILFSIVTQTFSPFRYHNVHSLFNSIIIIITMIMIIIIVIIVITTTTIIITTMV